MQRKINETDEKVNKERRQEKKKKIALLMLMMMMIKKEKKKVWFISGRSNMCQLTLLKM